MQKISKYIPTGRANATTEDGERMTDNDFRVPRMRSIKETAELFGLPLHFIRQKVNNGEIVAVRAGRRFLVNIDKLAEYLDTCTISQESNSGKIQPISLR